ncbi:hypothetical protein KKJ17_14905 [Xenorhabdus bovienii]|uniref:Phage protein n=1 Tax=Xenorhabdus bovienii TaxID=40576 RepID=A0AAJ1N0Q9_XENBV|nr:hypothetical protein [Xenorhabdus bovienii]MDE1479980.1 hypothetical protein [Xenorhabdus bovienii]MDE9511677.1 hypothetical protein [Xenorhabdus bovienii]MDE9518982.1 hypothetical protein [Xenorhabdus bovienii]MDE9523319.1 hypothetical protein [Xenorhabdus bovienii]
MADFTVRVELHKADASDYELLHEKMEAKGYSKEIKDSSGEKYKLPSAEYVTTKNKTSSEVRDEVEKIASSVKKNPYVLVTKSDGTAWLLSPV